LCMLLRKYQHNGWLSLAGCAIHYTPQLNSFFLFYI